MLSRSKCKLGKPEDVEGFLAYTERKSYGLATGLPTLDSQILGLQGIVSIVGEPKTCKSTLALQIALHNAQRGIPVFFIDRENGWRHMEQRIISHTSGTAWGEFCRWSKDAKIQALTKLYQLPFELCTENFDQNMLEEALVSVAAENPKAPHILLVLDSLHKLPMSLENMRMSIDGWLLFLDQLKLRFNRKLVILMTCEKNRFTYGKSDKASAKESGRIEYTVEQQFDMYRHPETQEIVMQCMYNRHGVLGDPISLTQVIKGGNKKTGFTFEMREVDGWTL